MCNSVISRFCFELGKAWLAPNLGYMNLLKGLKDNPHRFKSSIHIPLNQLPISLSLERRILAICDACFLSTDSSILSTEVGLVKSQCVNSGYSIAWSDLSVRLDSG
jgi:hypothetical protein